ncbi:uncharacterized protein LTR77_008836 [Saxophila tyrrhenica]|uniref:Organic hydroperoxide resistance protein n=1 Tax=Saxophila tyrrhenica TaxID=1690608 RepID=A0AAV9P168_9PEZI|nr:hypothetical protein LTR77_008836 [Saxophila tyrrhenica]
MASLRVLRPLVRQAPRAIFLPAPRRFLQTDSAPVLTTANAHVTGGRANGHVNANALNLDLGMPRELGGKGDKINPEELFAAGYGACFQSAMNATAKGMGLTMPEGAKDSIVDTTVNLVGDLQKLDLGLKVSMTVKVRGMSKEEIQKVVDEAKKACPYSRATQGNISTDIKVEVLE